MIRFNDEFILSPDGDAPARELEKLLALLKRGDPAEQRRALARLIAADAQDELTECLRCADDTVVQLATAGLWECWLNEKGEAARQMMEEGIELMEAGHFASSAKIFLTLIQQHPDWAEALNKQATLLYLGGESAASLELCKKVVALKPNHFGAWNGMALCAVELEDWQGALAAAGNALRIQPGAESNLEILRLAKRKLGEA